MLAKARAAHAALNAEAATGEPLDDSMRHAHLLHARGAVELAELVLLDDGNLPGIEMAERLFVEAFIQRADISHPPGWDTGRPSEPDFMDLNLQSTRTRDPAQPAVVVFQYDEAVAMNPRGLLVAYEEHGHVMPVASDFDAFLIGSRGLTYPPVPPEQICFLESLVDHVEEVLASPDERSWAHRWIEVLKGEGPSILRTARRSAIKGSLGQARSAVEGAYGFGDAMSRAMIEGACRNLHGAVRHAAESFNYYWPQELDEEFLIVWEGYPQRHWRHVGPEALRTFLIERAHAGFVFPLNPTWILRDSGWYDVFAALEATPQGREALESWLPSHSGLRERIKAIHTAYPHGLVGTRKADADVSHDMDLAELALRRHQTLRRAKLKMHTILVFMRAGCEKSFLRKPSFKASYKQHATGAQRMNAQVQPSSCAATAVLDAADRELAL